MRRWLVLLGLLYASISVSFAADIEELRVGITPFSPPFVIQSNLETFYGFDISTMDYVCTALEKKCVYIPLDYDDLIEATHLGLVDVAIGSIVITITRSQFVLLSIPYLPSNGQFIGKMDFNHEKPFNFQSLGGLSVGVLKGSKFEDNLLHIQAEKKPKIIEYEKDSDMVEALRIGRIDLAFVGEPKARYWSNHSGGQFKRIGKPFYVGYGFSIAVNPNDPILLRDVNAALIRYRESSDFKQNYDMYFRADF